MTDAFQPQLDFDAADEAAEDGEALVVDLDGYEGPLHVLLALARTQKVDLLKLSITRLAEQYLAFVQEARKRRFSLAADYLVMASWLAYLKSRLLLPKPERRATDEPPAEDLAAALAFRLMKLEAMRKAVEQLAARPVLKREVFMRGDPQATVVVPSRKVEASLYELMQAYVGQRRRQVEKVYSPGGRTEAFPLEAAREHLTALLPGMTSWTSLAVAAPKVDPNAAGGPTQASCLASTFSASLELVKEGSLEARQLEAFADIYLRARGRASPPAMEDA